MSAAVADLLETLRVDSIPHDELVTALTTLFPRAESERGDCVIYRLPPERSA